MAFEAANLTRLSGPLSVIFPEEGQSKYWAYRTTEDLTVTMADDFFPDTCGISPRDVIWIVFSDGGDPASYQVSLLYVEDDL